MGVIGGDLGYFLLRQIGGQGERDPLAGDAYKHKSKLETLLGKELWSLIRGKVVVDFGSGSGKDAVEMAQKGAKKVIGVDIRDKCLAWGRENAEKAGVSDICEFVHQPSEKVDVVVTVDSFEHFDDTAEALRQMYDLLKPNGLLIGSFGCSWLHPYGGHLFSVFPWAHLIFTEKSLIRWRSDFKTDGATRFNEVEGGLNQMTIRRFKRIVEESPFEVDELVLTPIRKLRWLHNPLTREFTTSVVRCKLRPAPAYSSHWQAGLAGQQN